MVDMNEQHRQLFECSFPLSYWAKGTDYFDEIITQISDYVSTLNQLNIWFKKDLLIPKPTFCNSTRLVFLVDELIVDKALQLKGVSGGYPKNIDSNFNTKNHVELSANRKRSPRPKKVLLDLGVDVPEILIPLTQEGIEIIQIWDFIADLVQYEIIETCINQYIDLIVTSNTRLFTSSEEWINYLLPHRTKICYISEQYLANPKQITELLTKLVHSKKSYKSPNRPIFVTRNIQQPTKQSREEEG